MYVCMYVCMHVCMYVCICLYGRTCNISKRMDQPDKVANPTRGQLNRENEHFFPVLVRILCLVYSIGPYRRGLMSG